MYSISFPKMLANNETLLSEDSTATLSNLRLLLLSDKYSLLGDPYFGTNLKQFIYEQNNTVLKDLLIDEIYVAIKTFMPQIQVTRKDITVLSESNTSVSVTISCISKINNQSNLYTILLTDSTNEVS